MFLKKSLNVNISEIHDTMEETMNRVQLLSLSLLLVAGSVAFASEAPEVPAVPAPADAPATAVVVVAPAKPAEAGFFRSKANAVGARLSQGFAYIKRQEKPLIAGEVALGLGVAALLYYTEQGRSILKNVKAKLETFGTNVKAKDKKTLTITAAAVAGTATAVVAHRYNWLGRVRSYFAAKAA